MQPRVLAVLYLMLVAFLLGMVVEKMRFGARRDAVMSRYEQSLRQWRALQMRTERDARPPLGAPRPPGDR
jgi:hypothetical protein